MDFLNLIKKEKGQLSRKWLQLVIAVIVLFVVVLFSIIKSDKPDVYAHDFLPPSASFYYEWSNKQAIDKGIYDYGLFDKEIPLGELAKVRNLLADNFSKVQELIWFKLEDREEDFYLLRFSDIKDKDLYSLHDLNPNTYFYKPAPNVLFISPDETINKDISAQIVSRWNLNYNREGINAYWQIDRPPAFFKDLSVLVAPVATVRDAFVNFGDSSIDFYQPRTTSTAISDLSNFQNKKVPQNFDLALGFSASSTENFSQSIAENIILPNFESLPYENLSYSDLHKYLFKDSLLFSYEDGWLLVADTDWRSRASDLAKNLQLVEVKKTLPDGTLYTELQAADDQLVIERDFAGQKYWQIDNLYGWGEENAYYLSNRPEMIEDIMLSKVNLAALALTCVQSNKDISDFVRWQTDKLGAGPIKSFLEEQNIGNLSIFSYQNYLIKGVKLCF